MCSGNQSTHIKKRLLEQVNGDEVLLHELIALFFASSDEMMENLRRAIEATDYAQIRKSTHRLKGAISMFALDLDMHSLARIEQWSQEPCREKIVDEWYVLEKEMQDLKELLKELEPPAGSL